MKTVSKYVNKFKLSCNCEIIKKISSYIFRVNGIVSKQKDHEKVNDCVDDIFLLKIRSQKKLLLESILHISQEIPCNVGIVFTLLFIEVWNSGKSRYCTSI